MESQTKPQEKKENPPSKAERVSAEGLREVYEGPLDLSDRGKSKSNQSPTDYSPLALKDADRVQNSPDKDVKTNSTTHGPVSSPHCVILPSSSPRPPVKQHEEEPASDHETKVILGLLGRKLKGCVAKEWTNMIHGLMVLSQQVIKEQEQKEEVNGKTDQSSEKKVPVLTITLRPGRLRFVFLCVLASIYLLCRGE